ncbi:STE3-domain-containing protein [Russula earlei]|uniref:STE3-domain-containing protein n=1 Tax=Russula earlei TaxID=71964 RepID=A0ACC0UK96_9AGAM|nr:STE3-domain-containing protein [Russula earlei]
MAYLPNQVYTVFSFVGFVLCAIPLYWHLEAWNVGTCMAMVWIGLGCLIQCINSIVWNKNTTDKAPVWCFISVQVQFGLTIAISASSLCIHRRLYKIATAKEVMVKPRDKRQAIVIDLIFGLGLPILQMIVGYVVSVRRYDLYEDVGPRVTIMDTLPAYFLFYASFLALVVCAMTVYHLYRRLRHSRQINLVINRGLYFRLMAFISVDVLSSIPLTAYLIVLDERLGVRPWIIWTYESFQDYSQVRQIPASDWESDPYLGFAVEYYRWMLVVYAFFFFSIFGFAEEARRHYRLVYAFLADRIRVDRLMSSCSRTRPGHGPSHDASYVARMRRSRFFRDFPLSFSRPHVKKNDGGGAVAVHPVARPPSSSAPREGDGDRSSIMFIGPAAGEIASDPKIANSLSDALGSSFVDTFVPGSEEGRSREPLETAPDPPDSSDERPICGYSGDAVDTVMV